MSTPLGTMSTNPQSSGFRNRVKTTEVGTLKISLRIGTLGVKEVDFLLIGAPPRSINTLIIIGTDGGQWYLYLYLYDTCKIDDLDTYLYVKTDRPEWIELSRTQGQNRDGNYYSGIYSVTG